LQKLFRIFARKIRKEIWGYSADENCTEAMIEGYKGIRPAPGYPACPDHLKTYWKLLNVEKRSNLDGSMAMWPASSVSGYYFGNPK
jgi:5-methyltetrahydrofolate--homocysteine methyltransferase